jgi:hypothetical protein
MPETFDLFGDSALARSNYIRQIQRTVETYDIDLKVVLELLQNAIDASVRGKSSDIYVDIDLPGRRVTVSDSGPGFPPNRTLLYLGGTDKDTDPQQKGKIGVGLKAVLFSSSKFHIRSVGDHGLWELDVVDADDALTKAHKDPATQLQVTETLDKTKQGESFGTTVTVEFRDRQIHDWIDGATEHVFTVEELGEGAGDAAKLLYEYGAPFATKADAFLHLYFRTAPYSADVKKLLLGGDPLTIHVHLKVGDTGAEFPDSESMTDMLKATEYSLSILAEYCDFEPLIKAIPVGKFKAAVITHEMPPGGDAGVALPDRIWILKLTTREQIETLIRNRAGLVTAGHESALGRINGVYLVLGDPVTLRQFIPGGAKRLISSNGIITAHAFSTPRGARHELYIPRIHMIVDVDADLNYGKRHLNDRRLVNYLQQFFAEAYARTLFEATKGLSATIRRPRDATDRSYVALTDLGLDLAVVKEPEVEQDVIALFCALMGAGIVDGIALYGISQVEQYDGRFYSRRAKDKADPPFTTDDNLYKLEFKHKISQLCVDFEADEKDPREIQLAIVWKSDALPERWKMLDLTASTVYSDGRHFPKVNRVLWDTKESHEVQVIVLEELVAGLLEDAEGSPQGADGR